jgi:hypothetical protein
MDIWGTLEVQKMQRSEGRASISPRLLATCESM